MKTILYLGLNPPQAILDARIIHCPLIQISPRPKNAVDIVNAFKKLSEVTHILLTSKTALHLFFEYADFFQYKRSIFYEKKFIAVGKATGAAMRAYGVEATYLPIEESSEGLVAMFEEVDFSNSYLLWPHSALSRDVLPLFFTRKTMNWVDCILYDTRPRRPDPLPSLCDIDEIVFTSPSTVNAFLQFFGPIPQNKVISAIGPVTFAALPRCDEFRENFLSMDSEK